MARMSTCPACGGGVPLKGADRLRCSQCGTAYRTETQWVPLVATVLILAVGVGALAGTLIDDAGQRIAITAPLWVLIALTASRRFRRLVTR